MTVVTGRTLASIRSASSSAAIRLLDATERKRSLERVDRVRNRCLPEPISSLPEPASTCSSATAFPIRFPSRSSGNSCRVYTSGNPWTTTAWDIPVGAFEEKYRTKVLQHSAELGSSRPSAPQPQDLVLLLAKRSPIISMPQKNATRLICRKVDSSSLNSRGVTSFFFVKLEAELLAQRARATGFQPASDRRLPAQKPPAHGPPRADAESLTSPKSRPMVSAIPTCLPFSSPPQPRSSL